MIINRVWAMPAKDTFDCIPIGNLVQKYLKQSKISIDPFARNKRWATYTNDLSPETLSEYHMEARKFLDMLIARGIQADLVICDPPYSQVQVSRAYKNIGREYKPFGDDNNATLYKQVRDKLNRLLLYDGIAVSLGWNSAGFGLSRGYEILEILLVCHGGAHNDTIITVERKINHQEMLTL